MTLTSVHIPQMRTFAVTCHCRPDPSVVLVNYLANSIIPQLMLSIFHQYIALNFTFFKGHFPLNF